MTIETLSYKNICVPDASSLLYSAQLELKGKKIFEWILDKYQVYISPEVKYECFQNLQKGHVNVIDSHRFKRDITNKEAHYMDYKECLKYLERYCNENNMKKFKELGDGEKHSVALCLYLNLKFDKPIILLIDDFGATDIINSILKEQKFAIQSSIPDFLINLFKTNLNLSENSVTGVLQSYYCIMRKAIMHKIFKNRMNYNCRSFWIQNCFLRCT